MNLDVEGIFNFISELAKGSPLWASLSALLLGVISTSSCPFTVPAGVGIVRYSGSLGVDAEEVRRLQREGALFSLSFFLAILLTFFLLGVLASYTGRFLSESKALFSFVAALASMIAGFAMIFSPALRRNVGVPKMRVRGVPGAFLFGIAYSLTIVTTSTGPLLLLLTAAAVIGSPLYGGALSFAYGFGRGLPFLFLGFFSCHVRRLTARFGKGVRVIELLIGASLVILGVILFKTSAS